MYNSDSDKVVPESVDVDETPDYLVPDTYACRMLHLLVHDSSISSE